MYILHYLFCIFHVARLRVSVRMLHVDIFVARSTDNNYCGKRANFLDEFLTRVALCLCDASVQSRERDAAAAVLDRSLACV